MQLICSLFSLTPATFSLKCIESPIMLTSVNHQHNPDGKCNNNKEKSPLFLYRQSIQSTQCLWKRIVIHELTRSFTFNFGRAIASSWVLGYTSIHHVRHVFLGWTSAALRAAAEAVEHQIMITKSCWRNRIHFAGKPDSLAAKKKERRTFSIRRSNLNSF